MEFSISSHMRLLSCTLLASYFRSGEECFCSVCDLWIGLYYPHKLFFHYSSESNHSLHTVNRWASAYDYDLLITTPLWQEWEQIYFLATKLYKEWQRHKPWRLKAALAHLKNCQKIFRKSYLNPTPLDCYKYLIDCRELMWKSIFFSCIK